MVVSQQHLVHMLNVCKQPGRRRTDKDIWFLRDRLHECSSFFRLWPSQLQQLLCRLMQARQWVQHEVLAAAGSRPEELCFIVDGEAAVAVRADPGSSLLRDVVLLRAGDSFGELCLLGKQRHPAFVVVRSQVLTTVSVKAQELAEAIAAMQQQEPCSTPASALQGCAAHGSIPCSSSDNNSSSCQQLTAAGTGQSSSVNVDTLYQLIGQPRGPPKGVLKPEQAQQVKQLFSRQLQEAAAAEAATVGAWQQLPHERLLGALTLEEQAGVHERQLRQGLQTADVPDQRQQPQQQRQQLVAGSLGQTMEASGQQDMPASNRSQAAASQPDDGTECAHGVAAAAAGASSPGGSGAADATAAVQQLAHIQEPVPRSPLMHHAAIMQVATRKAAGQTVL